MRNICTSFFILGLILSGTLYGWYQADYNGVIKGTVKNLRGEPLSGANIVIIENNRGSATDLSGSFEINNLEPGKYTLRISHVAYETTTKILQINKNKNDEVHIELKQSLFQIGGIEVIGSSQLLPTNAVTATIITSGEIEHYQASSVKDVLDLVPGIQKSENPGLSKSGQIAVRSNIQDRVSTFGTLILVDGVPISTNSDMQFERPGAGGTLLNINGIMGGLDIRTIPADNIELIEVLTGLPSVKYGDFTDGVLNIKTKTGLQPHRLKIKDNPDTREANLGGGFAIGENGMSYNFNAARSERDIRIEGDEYTRFSAQTVYFSKALNSALSINHKVSLQMIYDEEKPEGDVYKKESFDRGFTTGYTSWGTYRLSDHAGSLDFNLFATMQRENSMKSRLVQSDLRILPNGDTIAAYMGKVQTKGFEWTLGGKVDWNKIYNDETISHKFLAGADVQYNRNSGEGIVFDTVYSYYGPDAGNRPYRFSSLPGQTLLSFYAEDQITGNLFFDFKFSAGVRYETYRPFRFNPKGLWGKGDLIESHQGSFFNPRISFIIFFSQSHQLRLNGGKSSKSPSMGLIYPPETVFRWRNPYNGNIQHLRYDRTSPDLKGISETQLEVSYDHKVLNEIAGSVSFFYKERKNETRETVIPVFYLQNSGDKEKIYYIDSYSRIINSGWNISKGTEFTLKTNRINALNMNFQISGSFNYINGSNGGDKIKMEYDISRGQYPNYQYMDTLIGFVFPNKGKWHERIQFNYYVKYTLPPLGLWISLRAEQVVGEREQEYGLEPSDYNLLTESGKQKYLFERRIRTKGPKWLFNFNISKSLFNGAEISFYVNNFLDNPALRKVEILPGIFTDEVRNPALFYGIEFSTIIDEVIK